MPYTNPASMTPGRRTQVIFDLVESVCVEQAFTVTRAGSEIGKNLGVGQADTTPALSAAQSQNVKVWPSGAITLMPLQQDIANLHEFTVTQASIIGYGGLTVTQGLVASAIMAIQAQQSLPGFMNTAVASGVQTAGDPWIVKQVPLANTTWQSDFVGVTPTPYYVTQNIPMDRVLYSTTIYRANQGFFLQWYTPGAPTATYNYHMGFLFGQYGLYLTGGGTAELWEYCFNTTTNALEWHRMASWQYLRAGQVTGVRNTMAIWPHSDPSGHRYIAFSNSQVTAAGLVSSFTGTDANTVAPGDFLYRCDSPTRPANLRDAAQAAATVANIIELDIRRDLRLKVQLSTLAWATSGYVVDLPAALPPAASADTPVNVFPNVLVPGGGTYTATLQDANTGAAFTPGANAGPAVRHALTGDGTNTPILWEYRLVRDAVSATISPASFTATPFSVSVTGYSGDASHDTAQLVIKDGANALTRLRTRGRLSCAIVVADSLGVVVLHRGYALLPSATQRGKATGPYASSTFPAPRWRRYDIPAQGMSKRLAELYNGPTVRVFGLDQSAPVADQVTGTPGDGTSVQYAPWKATDIIRQLLVWAGFPASQIDIPDVDIRIWPGEATKADDNALAPASDYGSLIQRMAHDYLGAYFVFLPNAGATDANGIPCGQWSLLFQTPYPASGYYAPIVNFVTVADYAHIPPQLPGAYTTTGGVPDVPILKELSYTNKPPEFNHIFVTTSLSITGTTTPGRVESHAYNYASYQVPGSGVTPDPNSPDYIGYEIKAIFPDSTLGAGGTAASAQANCDWVCRRLYDSACHGQVVAHVTAPLVFVTDPAGYRRTLQFQDQVAINGDAVWLVKSVVINYDKDGFQQAEYELIAPVAGQYVPPGLLDLSFGQDSDEVRAQKNTGNGTQGLRYGKKTVPAHKEQAMMEQPCLLTYQKPLQNSSGAFYAIADYDPADSGVVA